MTPTPEFRNTLDAALLASVEVAAAATRSHSIQFVVPKVPKITRSTAPSRRNDLRYITTSNVRPGGVIINTGGYLPRFLDSVPGLQYEVRTERLVRLAPKEVMKYVTDLKVKARRSSFSYVEGRNIVTIFAKVGDDGDVIRDWKEFADACGLVIGNSTKISKRLKELVRLTRMFARFDKLDIKYFEHDDPSIPQMHVDGASIVSRRVALRCCTDPHTRRAIQRGEISSVSIRVITPQGLIKGDAIIVPNRMIKCDIYTSVHNLKGELATKEGYVITMEPHHPSAPARTNDQLLSWFSGLFPLDQLKFTVRRFLVENFRKLARGEYPTYLVSLPKLKDGVDSNTLFRLAPHKWLAHGRRLNESSALITQAGSPIVKQLISEVPQERGRNGELFDVPWRQKVRVPILWAFYGHFMTDTVIQLAGYKIPTEARGKLFFHKESGRVVIPAEHFAQYYRNHGGWDLDDSAMVIIRKIDGELKAIIVRSPNSWGEYSIIDVYMEGLPLYFQYGEIPEVDSSVLPTQIQDLVIDDPDKDRSLPTGTFKRDNPYGYDDFDYALACALENPGTGSLINLFCIAYNAIFGTYNRDPFAETEDVVDSTQQNQTIEALLRLQELRDLAKDLLIQAMEEGQPVDPLIFERRMNLSDEEKALYRSVANFVPGIFTQLKSMVQEEVDLYEVALKQLARLPLGEASAHIRVGNTMRTFTGGRILLDFSGIDFSSVVGTEVGYWRDYTRASTTAGRVKMTPEERRAHWQRYSDGLVAKLLAKPEARRDLELLNFFSFIQENGHSDTSLFTTPSLVDGVVNTGPLDLLVDAMVRHGMATLPSWKALGDLIEEAEEQSD